MDISLTLGTTVVLVALIIFTTLERVKISNNDARVEEFQIQMDHKKALIAMETQKFNSENKTRRAELNAKSVSEHCIRDIIVDRKDLSTEAIHDIYAAIRELQSGGPEAYSSGIESHSGGVEY